MGKLPAILVAVVAFWLAWNVFANGPEKALGGLFGLFYEPQYGQADRPTRTGSLADRVLEEGATRTARDDR
jgi:hypothetical protein